MFRIVASLGDGWKEVGRQETLEKALHYADNTGTLFSEGGSKPIHVLMMVENDEGSIKVVQEFYNGFVKVLESIGV